MKEIPVDKLKPIPRLPVAVLHKSGIIILQPGEALDEDIIAAVKDAGVESLFFPAPTDRLDELRRELTHVSMSIDELTPGDTLTRTLYDDGGHLLLEEGAAIPASFADSLRRRAMDTIYFRKPPETIQPKVARTLRAGIEKIQKGDVQFGDKEVVEAIEKIELKQADVADLNEDSFRAKLDTLDKIEIQPSGEAFEKQVVSAKERGPATEQEKRSFTDVVQSSLTDLREIFDALSNGQGRNVLPLIDRVATRALTGLIRNRELLMLCGTDENVEDYMCSHSLAMAVIATNVGTSMKYDAAQIKSLAYGALLADAGMLKVPAEILQKTERLSPREYAEIKRHPAYGLDLLQTIHSIPEAVPYVVYQSHERANGSGYPCSKKDVVIHPFAKIVSAADIYTSVCSRRPYREAKMPYEAMEQLVLMCGKRLLNSQIIRAFLACNSMFPVGSFVRLNDQRGARVVGANPSDYMRPFLAMLTDAENKTLSAIDRLDLLENKELSVTQAILRTDVPIGDDLMIGF